MPSVPGDRDFFEAPADEYLRALGIEPIRDIALINRLRAKS
jgi:hypothetical protein